MHQQVTDHEPQQDRSESSDTQSQHINTGNIRKYGKLAMAQIKQLSPADKLLYLSKLDNCTNMYGR